MKTALAICVIPSAILLAAFLMCSPNIVRADDPAPAEPTPQPANDAIAAQTAKLLEQLAEIETRLKNADPGPETRKLQQGVIDTLDALLKQPPSKKPQQQGQGGGGGGKSSAGPKQPPKSSEKKSDEESESPMSEQNSSGDEGKSRQNSTDSTERRGPTRSSSAALQRKQLEIEIWGHLPEKLRQQLLNSYGERMLPQYEAQVRKFYEKLAEPRNESSPKR